MVVEEEEEDDEEDEADKILFSVTCTRPKHKTGCSKWRKSTCNNESEKYETESIKLLSIVTGDDPTEST